MLAKLKAMWKAVLQWCSDSEVIVFGRMQVLGGILLAVVPTLNPMPWIDSTLTTTQRLFLAGWAVFSGVLTEIARRYRATDM